MIEKLRRLFKSTGVDKGLYAAVVFLAIFGIIMIGDVSVGMSTKMGSTYATFNMLKQLLFVFLGSGAMIFFARTFKTRYINDRRMSVFYIIVLIMMVMCLGWTINNSHAWIKLGPFTIQPAEFMKIVLILLLSFHFGDLPYRFKITRRMSRATRERLGNRKLLYCVGLPFLAIGVAFVVCAAIQKDLGSGLIIGFISLTLFLAAPAKYFSKLKKIILIGLITVIVLFFLLGGQLLSHQMARFASWLNPLSDIYGSNYQILNGLVAFSNGGLIGLGFGKSIMKFGYIPEAQNDYVASIIVEELGLIGFAMILIPYTIIIIKLFRYALKVKSPVDKLILIGIATYFFAHLFVNLGGISGLIPMTGVPLLLVSAGGSSTWMAMLSIGIAQAIIARYNRDTLQGEIEEAQ